MLDVFTEQKRYVIVNLADGRRVFGWPMYYSNNPEEGCLYLYDAWINDEGKYIDLRIHGLFLADRIHQCFFVGCASPLDKLRTGFTQPLIDPSNVSRRIETRYP